MIRLEDGDVVLREFVAEDSLRMQKIANNKKIAINLRDGFPHPYTLEDAERFIGMFLKQDPVAVFAIQYKGVYAGNIGLHKLTDVYRYSAEIGYFLGEQFWNQGIMTKAVNMICSYGFRELGIIRIHTGVFEYNTASQKVLEKCGFEKEAVFRDAVFKNGKICNEVRYALLAP